MSSWSHLPNAAHIDAVLADVKVRPEVWAGVWDDAWNDAWDDALEWCINAIPSTCVGVGWDRAWSDALEAVSGTMWDGVWGAVCGLIAWPESAALLDLTPDALRTIISTCDGDVKHQAVLLLPAVIVRSTV